MSDIFVGGLAVGLVILAALLLVTNASWTGVGFASAGSWFAPAGPQPELITAELGASYQAGRIVTQTVDELDLGTFDISGRATTVALPSGIVQSGVFFGERTLRYSIDNPATISFTVEKTNSYAPLTIKANGAVVAEKEFELGPQTVPINLVGPVELEFSVPSSGWRLWAPVLYELSNISVRITHPTVSYVFARGENLAGGELVLSFAARQGNLTVLLNDKQLWSGAPNATKTVGFASMADANTLTVKAGANASFAGTAILRMYYEKIEHKVYETTFNLTPEQQNKLPGHIVFEIPSVQHRGSIIAKLVVGDQTKLAEAIDAESGTHAVAFFPSNIVPGQPTKLVIEGGDDATFYVRNLKVWV